MELYASYVYLAMVRRTIEFFNKFTELINTFSAKIYWILKF